MDLKTNISSCKLVKEWSNILRFDMAKKLLDKLCVDGVAEFFVFQGESFVLGWLGCNG